jgi:hypothetical protein
VPSTRCFDALRLSVRFEVPSRPFRSYLDELFASFPTAPRAGVVFEVRRASTQDDRYEIYFGGELGAERDREVALLQPALQELNARAARSWPGVACHAGGVARDGNGILLPADPESGKSTLTAGLVRAGFEYLSDEAVAFRPGENVIEPYPKPLSLDRGSWHLFPELEPFADLPDDDYKKRQWQVPPDAIRTGAAGGPCPARLVVFPKYVERARTEVSPIGRAEALVELARNTFSFNEQSRFALEELSRIVREVDCYRLTVGNLDDAVARISGLVERLPERADG